MEEIIESGSEKLLTLRQALKGLPDLAKGLSRIQYGQVCDLTRLGLISCITSCIVYTSRVIDFTARI